MDKAADRRRRTAWAEQERIVYGVNWGMALAHDQKGRVSRKWKQLSRRMSERQESEGLTGAALEAAVMAIASADPSLVKIEAGA